MKRLFFIPLLIISTGLFAQKFQFGIKGGVNVSNFTGGDFEDVDKKALIGFHGGAFLGLMFGENFSIQPEATFSSQGAKFKSAGQEENFKISYLNVPVLLKYRFNGGFYIEAGPQVGFKLSEKFGDTDVEDFAKDLDLAIDAGIGYHSNVGFGVGARYIAGISKVGDVDNSDLNPDFRNGVAQIFVFYTLFNNNRDK